MKEALAFDKMLIDYAKLTGVQSGLSTENELRITALELASSESDHKVMIYDHVVSSYKPTLNG